MREKERGEMSIKRRRVKKERGLLNEDERREETGEGRRKREGSLKGRGEKGERREERGERREERG